MKLNTVPWSNLSAGGPLDFPFIGELPVGTEVLATQPASGATHVFVIDESMDGKSMCWDLRKDAPCAR